MLINVQNLTGSHINIRSGHEKKETINALRGPARVKTASTTNHQNQ